MKVWIHMLTDAWSPRECEAEVDDPDVIDIDARRQGSWWTGYVACECGALWVGVVECKDGRPPSEIPCAECDQLAVPEPSWSASAEIHCGLCGHQWTEIFLHHVDLLPEVRRCSRCSRETKDIRPWPE